MELCKQAQESIRWKRPIIHPLRKRGCNLIGRERETLSRLFEITPSIGGCHEFKEKLYDLLRLKSQTIRPCRRNIRKLKEMMSMMDHEAAPKLRKIGMAIRKWLAPIIRMWRYRKNNGITEGFHRKMKLIRRRAYKYRNFENTA